MAADTSQQKVRLPVAVDVRELRDVLPVGVDRLAQGIEQRVGCDDESRRGTCTDVAVVADIAERRFGEQIDEAVAIDIGEAVPLPDVEILIAVGLQLPASGGPLKQREIVRVLLNEQVIHAVAVDIDELRARVLEAAEEWECVGVAERVRDWERRDRTDEGCRGYRGRWRLVEVRGAGRAHDHDPRESQGFPPATPRPAPSGAVSTRPTTARFFASITISRPGAAMPGIGIAMLMPPIVMTLSVL